jgi:hypothetical protein
MRHEAMHTGEMPDKTYVVRIRAPSDAIQHVLAAGIQIIGEHLVLVDSHGELAAIFLKELIQSVLELPS